MTSKILHFIRQYSLIDEGDRVVCAVSGGADSIALLWGLYLLKDTLKITLFAAHFNHRLRGAESERDETFVRDFCAGYGIPLTVGSGTVVAGKKGLEAAARDARYAFLRTLPGKIATAHTADDNAETVLLHLVRGTGLKGLGAIAPKSGNLIRPMLSVTRQEVEDFLHEYNLRWITDSSNETDVFLRNRLRRHVMPLLKAENPRLSENLSAMALRLREDEQALEALASGDQISDVAALRVMVPALRARALSQLLTACGVREPEAEHIRLAEALVFSGNPSARASFPGGVTITRRYDRLARTECSAPLPTTELPENGSVQVGPWRITVSPASEILNTPELFTVCAHGPLFIRARQSGDVLRLSGGTKTLKKLLIDRKIPAARRDQLPVVCDKYGILGVGAIGVSLDRAAASLPAVQLRFQNVEISETLL